jgi:ubiquinone/menaquinone biosynthesis C-methylase UbiE
MTSRALDQQEQDWQEMAELDPYWAILTKPGTRFGQWDSDAFFATGPPEVKAVMERAAILGYPRQHHLALDFGCGLGRVTRALTGYFEEVIGLDISETMIRRAQELSGDLEGVSFVVNRAADLRSLEGASFDFIYSVIVLQHVADTNAIRSYIADFCRVLRPGGLLVFQLPSHIPAIFRLQWRRRLYVSLRRLGLGAPLLYRRLHLLPIAMSSVPESEITSLLDRSGARLLDVDTHAATGLLNAGVRSCTYWATR